jgi:hypothetical protein
MYVPLKSEQIEAIRIQSILPVQTAMDATTTNAKLRVKSDGTTGEERIGRSAPLPVGPTITA